MQERRKAYSDHEMIVHVYIRTCSPGLAMKKCTICCSRPIGILEVGKYKSQSHLDAEFQALMCIYHVFFPSGIQLFHTLQIELYKVLWDIKSFVLGSIL